MKRILILFALFIPSLGFAQGWEWQPPSWLSLWTESGGTLTYDGSLQLDGDLSVESGKKIYLDGPGSSVYMTYSGGIIQFGPNMFGVSDISSSLGFKVYADVPALEQTLAYPLKLLAKDASDGSALGVSIQQGTALTTAGDKALTIYSDAGTTMIASVGKDGDISQSGSDESGTPGAATINKPLGQVSVAAAASSVVVTNSLVSTTSVVIPVLQFVDATCTQVLSAVPASGSFTINMNAACTANTKVGFTVDNQL